MIKARFKSMISVFMAMVILLTGIPFIPGGGLSKVHAGTDLILEPNRIPVNTGSTVIKFSFNDADVGQTAHYTEIYLCEPGANSSEPPAKVQGGMIKTDTFVIKNPDGTYMQHQVPWAAGSSIPVGNYNVCVDPRIPGQTEFYGTIAPLEIYDPQLPPLSSPTLAIFPNLTSESHEIKGTADPDSEVTLTIQYIKREGNNQVPGGTKVVSGIMADSSGNWSTIKQLDAYEIATITARAKKGEQISPVSSPLKVLRYKAPDWNVPWTAVAGYYYKTTGIAETVNRINEIASFNNYPQFTCVDGETCQKNLKSGENLLIINPMLAGEIGYKELEDLTIEKIAQRLQHHFPAWWDPINLANGSFSFHHTNMSLQAVMPLEFALTYHSRDKYEGAVGVGWHHSFEWVLHEWDQGHIYVTTPEGARYNYAPVGSGQFLTPKGTHNTLTQLSNGTYELVMPNQWKYLFREDGLLHKIQDTNGNEITLQYRGSVLVKAVTTGAEMSFAYDTVGKLTKVTDHSGRSTEYRYDEVNRNLTDIVLPDAAVISFKYDVEHQMTEISNPNKTSKLINEYDAQGRVIRQTDFSGATGEVQYMPNAPVNGNMPGGGSAVTKDPLGRIKTFEYDERFRQTAIHYPDGTTERFAYDENDHMTAKTDRNGYTTKFDYDALGNLIQVTDPRGATTSLRYNAFGKPEEMTDALGNKTVIAYDDRGNMKTVTNALGQTMSLELDARGVPTKITNPLGEAVTMTLDASGFARVINDPAGHAQELKRDPLHRVQEVKDALGNISKIEYDPRDRMKTRIDALQHQESFEYDKNCNLTGHTDAAGARMKYEYDSFDRLISVTDAMQQKTTYAYDEVGNRTKVTDANGAVTEYKYNNVNRIEKIIDPEGFETNLIYDGNGNLLTLEDPKGGRTEIKYDERNQPVEIKDASGAITKLTYDILGRLVHEESALGYGTQYAYDVLGRVTKVTDAMSNITSYAYNEAGRLDRVTQPNGAVWQMQYDARGQLTGTIDPLGHTTRLERDALGRVTVSKDEAGNATTYGYDALGRVTTIVNALGHVTSIDYDAVGRVKKMTDAKQQTTEYDYDVVGRLTAVTNALHNKTSYAYDAVGNITGKTDALGRVTSYQYNPRGLLKQVINPLQEITKLAYDGNGNMLSMIHPDGQSTSYQYDVMNRLTDILYADSSNVNYTYDMLGRRTAMKDSTGTTSYLYDALNRLTQVKNGADQTIGYEWTPTSQRSKVVYPDGKAVNYGYDLMDRMTSVTDGNGQTTRYEYDAKGHITSKTLPTEGVSTYQYDALGQVLEIRHANRFGKAMEQLKYVYDPVGNRTQMERSHGYEHDEPNDEPHEEGDRYTQYGEHHEDDHDHRKPLITNYAYDALNQLTRVQQYNEYDDWKHGKPEVTDYSYDTVGNRLSKTVPYGKKKSLEHYTYNEADRLTHWQNGKYFKDYTYDDRGNLLKVTGKIADDDDHFWDFNDDERVSNNVYGSSVSGNVYLGRSNERFDRNQGGHQEGNNRDDRDDDYYEDNDKDDRDDYHGDKEHLPYVLEEYKWNAANRLAQKTNLKGDLTRFSYDGDGNRVGQDIRSWEESKEGSGKDWDGKDHGFGFGFGHWDDHDDDEEYVTRFSYTNDVSLLLPEVIQVTAKGHKDYHGEGHESRDDHHNDGRWEQLRTSFVYGAGQERLSMTYPEKINGDHDDDHDHHGKWANTSYYLQDALGSIIGMVEQRGHLDGRWQYDEFGIPQSQWKYGVSSAQRNMFGYTGLEYDRSTGLNYARARYYKPEIGRFISEDTYKGSLWNPQSQNGYTYVHNNPINWIDPSGHWCTSPDGNWSHPGACEDASSTWSPDHNHIGEKALSDGEEYGEYFSKNSLSVDDKYVLWIRGDNEVYLDSNRIDQLQMRKWALQSYMEYQIKNGFPDLQAGFAYDFLALSDPQQALILGMMNRTTPWDIKTGASNKIDYNINGSKVSAYQDSKTGLYWSRDTEGHGGSAYKVFEKRGNELRWVADSDEYGNYIPNKHKGTTGLRIKIK